jgi:hypothetical protein
MRKPGQDLADKDDVPWWMKYAGRGLGTVGSFSNYVTSLLCLPPPPPPPPPLPPLFTHTHTHYLLWGLFLFFLSCSHPYIAPTSNATLCQVRLQASSVGPFLPFLPSQLPVFLLLFDNWDNIFFLTIQRHYISSSRRCDCMAFFLLWPLSKNFIFMTVSYLRSNAFLLSSYNLLITYKTFLL